MGIKFGTDGWRAVIADDYTFENLRKISKATAIAFQEHPKLSTGIVIGYDTRFLSKEFAECSASVFADHRIKVYLTDSFVTTPTVSLLTRDKNLAFGVMITSSHNPAKYNGFKLKDEFGGSMGTSQLNDVEKKLQGVALPEDSYSYRFGVQAFDEFLNSGDIEYINGREYYLNNIERKINIQLVKASGIKIIYDAMFGSGQGVMEGLMNLRSLRSEINPSFGGYSPEPVLKNITDIMNEMKKGDYDIGIVTDGDADRLAILDENGNFIDAQKTFALLLLYLLEDKGMGGSVVRGFSASDLIEKICKEYNLKLYTVPIGFKYISEIMIKEDVLIGAEESGGIGIKGHLPERDGIYNGLLFAEMLATKKKKLSELIKDMDIKFGKYFYSRVDKHLPNGIVKEDLVKRTNEFQELAGMKIINRDNLDGCKVFFDDGWLLVRPSGTEPLLRMYAETYNYDKTNLILNDILKKLKI